tara:strand:- start:241 stop:489 length:249 start_codon:yes stop_codon:yes gene_type:complete
LQKVHDLVLLQSKIHQEIPEGENSKDPDEAEPFKNLTQISEASLRMYMDSNQPSGVGQFPPVPMEDLYASSQSPTGLSMLDS